MSRLRAGSLLAARALTVHPLQAAADRSAVIALLPSNLVGLTP
jgi:hypothetical protein